MSAATHLPADEIPAPLFRQILLVPFALEAPGGEAASLDELVSRAAARLDAADSQWRRVPDPLFHLDLDPSVDVSAEARAARLAPAYEEFVYFEPYVQAFLFPGPGRGDRGDTGPCVRLWRFERAASIEIVKRTDPAADKAETNEADKEQSAYRFAVERANLYLFETGNALLALELRLTSQRIGSQEVAPTLQHVLLLLESVRRVFPPYFERKDETRPLETPYFADEMDVLDEAGASLWKESFSVDATRIIEKVVGQRGARADRAVPLFDPWVKFLSPLDVEGYGEPRRGGVQLSQLGDDRAFVLAQVGVADPRHIRAADWVRLCFLDSFGRDWPYAKPFFDDFAGRHAYDRFFDPCPAGGWNTRYLVCGYALVAVGPVAPEGDRETYFQTSITKHIRRQYFDLVLIALFQKIALKTLSDRIATVGTRQGRVPVEALIEMQRQVLKFTHRWWFEDISAQLQAQELFELLRKHLRLRELYEQLSAEAREANALAAQEKQLRIAEAAQGLNVIAAVGLAASVVVGFFGMNVFGMDGGASWTLDQAQVWALIFAIGGSFAFLFAAALWIVDGAWRRLPWGAGFLLCGLLAALHGGATLLAHGWGL